MKKNFVFKSPGLQIRNSRDADYQLLADEIASLSCKSASAFKSASEYESIGRYIDLS